MPHTRNALVILLATASLTSQAVALPNNGAFDKSAEAFKLRMQTICADVSTTADNIEGKGKSGTYDSPIAPPRGNDQTQNDNRSEAQGLRDKARGLGCKM